MRNIMYEGTHNPEHPEFELHYRSELPLADFDDGTTRYAYHLTNRFYVISIYILEKTGCRGHFLEPMRMCIYFDGGNVLKDCPINAFIIPDKPVADSPELGWISEPHDSEDPRSYHWRDNEKIPGGLYHAAMTLLEADRLVRNLYPGYCLVINKPELEIPDRLPEPFPHHLPRYVLEQEKAREQKKTGNA